jgi:hypothetical protein
MIAKIFIRCLLYRGAGVAPTDSADDPVSVGRNTRARTHIVELLARARASARANARTQSLPAFGYTCMVFFSFVGGYKFS